MEKEVNADRVAKGFNDGYLISQHDTELANTLKHSMLPSTDEYIIGLQKGLIELDKEKNLTDEFEKLRDQNDSKSLYKGR